MLPKSIENSIIKYLEKQNFPKAVIMSARPVSGGSINHAYRLKTLTGNLFLKYNDASFFPEMFEKEARGLNLLRSAGAIEIPEVLLVERTQEHTFLLLEYVDSMSEADNFWDDFGEKLAALHKTKAEKFGLDHSNYMGSLFQYNDFHADWTEFFIIERLERQIKMAREDGKILRGDVAAFERLFLRLDEIFPKTKPSLIHGDLWSGNFMVGASGNACLIDPAVYYGHPEIDIAMSTLFGGFSERFYEAYNRHNTLEKGWRSRLPVYNLYPLMVHVNLFGGVYLESVRQTLKRF